MYLSNNKKHNVMSVSVLVVASLALSTPVEAREFSACLSNFYQQTPPQLLKDQLRASTFPLCFSGFAVMYSGLSHTPLWSAEYLTPERLQSARTLDRQGEFHEEGRIPDEFRSHLSDYARSGYDRGHMSPNGDMGDRDQQADSFSLANMVPQSPYNNQEVWKNLEEATRALILKRGWPAYVITGPVFDGDQIRQVGQVLVPTHVYKVLYFPDQQAASVYLAVNDQQAAVQVISVAQLQRLTGIDVLPQVPSSVKSKIVNLPLNANQARKQNFDLWAGATTVNSNTAIDLPEPNQSSAPERTHKESHRSRKESGSESVSNEGDLKFKLLAWLVNWLAKK